MDFTKYEPVAAALLLADVPLVIGFINELASAHPSTYTTLLVGVALVVLNAVGAWARSKVTPVAKVEEARVAALPKATNPVAPAARSPHRF